MDKLILISFIVVLSVIVLGVLIITSSRNQKNDSSNHVLIIQGESDDLQTILGFLSYDPVTIRGEGLEFSISSLRPTFIKVMNSDLWVFQVNNSETVSAMRANRDRAYVVCCNNQYATSGGDMWKSLTDPCICIHVGDQVYNDGIYRKWSTQSFHSAGILNDFYEQFWKQWQGLPLWRMMNVFIPDDHEVTNDKYTWSHPEDTLLAFMAQECVYFYSGFRLNSWTFSSSESEKLSENQYFRPENLNWRMVAGNTLLVLNERFTKPFLQDLPSLDNYKHIIWIGGAPIVPLRTFETSPLNLDLLYEQLLLKDKVVLIGGDLHMQLDGIIEDKIPFFTASPMKNFTDVYVLQSNFQTNYNIHVTQIGRLKLNTLQIELESMRVRRFVKHQTVFQSIFNLFNTGYHFWLM